MGQSTRFPMNNTYMFTTCNSILQVSGLHIDIHFHKHIPYVLSSLLIVTSSIMSMSCSSESHCKSSPCYTSRPKPTMAGQRRNMLVAALALAALSSAAVPTEPFIGNVRM